MEAAISVLSPKSTTTVQSTDLFKQSNLKFLDACPLEGFSLNFKPVCHYKARVFPSLVVSASAVTTTTTAMSILLVSLSLLALFTIGSLPGPRTAYGCLSKNKRWDSSVSQQTPG